MNAYKIQYNLYKNGKFIRLSYIWTLTLGEANKTIDYWNANNNHWFYEVVSIKKVELPQDETLYGYTGMVYNV